MDADCTISNVFRRVAMSFAGRRWALGVAFTGRIVPASRHR